MKYARNKWFRNIKTNKIKSNKETREIQVIMMTGYMTEQEHLLDVYRIGVIDFIKKPFDNLEVIARVNSAVKLASYFKDAIERKMRELLHIAIRLDESKVVLKETMDTIESIQALNPIHDNQKIQTSLANLRCTLANNIADTNWKEFNNHFIEVHPDFYQNLYIIHIDLIPAELRLCALLRLNLSSKDISAIIHSKPDSIKVARNRLRKKLHLSEEANLTTYLVKF